MRCIYNYSVRDDTKPWAKKGSWNLIHSVFHGMSDVAQVTLFYRYMMAHVCDEKAPQNFLSVKSSRQIFQIYTTKHLRKFWPDIQWWKGEKLGQAIYWRRNFPIISDICFFHVFELCHSPFFANRFSDSFEDLHCFAKLGVGVRYCWWKKSCTTGMHETL